ncbi:hypothetical protein Goklo_005290, partial [Gossypium klotzschianum]|nr:hypothetical protein [Gossypium klotzschianum]
MVAVHQSPHVLIFPFPAQGHVNSMLKLAELLALASLRVTFLNSEYNHESLVRHTDILSRFAQYPGFKFETIPDGLSQDHPRINPPPDCIIGDGVLGLTFDVANELGIPIIPFRTISAGCVWVFSSTFDMIQAGELPIKGNQDMDCLITSVAGMETFLRFRDLPSFSQVSDVKDPLLQLMARETSKNFKANGLILNTFEELEGATLSQMRNKSKCPKIYTIGPLHEHLKARLADTNRTLSDRSSNSFREVDRSCISWLDKQPKGSVVFVSFGSIAVLPREKLMECWFGLVNSGKRFLWVLRPENVPRNDGECDGVPTELVEGTKERGYIVDWAPQEDVLSHGAIGG